MPFSIPLPISLPFEPIYIYPAHLMPEMLIAQKSAHSSNKPYRTILYQLQTTSYSYRRIHSIRYKYLQPIPISYSPFFGAGGGACDGTSILVSSSAANLTSSGSPS